MRVRVVATVGSLLKWGALVGLLAGVVWLWRAIDPVWLRVVAALLWLLVGVALLQLGAWLLVGALIVLASRDARPADRGRATREEVPDEHRVP